jgi:hypothetical protein
MARHPMLWRETEARLLTAQMRGVRWERLRGNVDKVMQGYKYLGVWAEMEMTSSRAGGSVGEYKE